MTEVQFSVVIDDSLPIEMGEPVVALGDFEGPSAVIYRSDPNDLSRSALQQFYRDLLLGRALPLKLVARKVQDIDEVLFLALFLDRRLVLQPSLPGILLSLDLARMGPSGMAHIDRDLARFISFARSYLGNKSGQRGDRVRKITEWLREYILTGSLPGLPAEPKPPRVVEVGSNGFVVAEAASLDLVEGWIELYRGGFLRGMLFGPASEDGLRMVLGARKSPLVELDLPKAARILNDAEQAMGELPGWVGESLWLWGPEEGTLLRPTDILGVLIRV